MLDCRRRTGSCVPSWGGPLRTFNKISQNPDQTVLGECDDTPDISCPKVTEECDTYKYLVNPGQTCGSTTQVCTVSSNASGCE